MCFIGEKKNSNSFLFRNQYIKLSKWFQYIMNNFESRAENWKPNHLVFTRQITIVYPLMYCENYDTLELV